MSGKYITHTEFHSLIVFILGIFRNLIFIQKEKYRAKGPGS